MQFDEMRRELRELSDRLPAGAIGVDAALDRAGRTVKRRRAIRSVASLAVIASVAMVAVAISASGPAAKKRVVVRDSTTTSVARDPALPFTDEQLRAHAGVGVPRGWAPVDEGAARVWVPSRWTLAARGSCPGGVEFGLVGLGESPGASCDSPVAYKVPAEAVSLLPSTRARHDTPNRIVHGYRVYLTVPKCICPWSAIYEVPQLGVQIRARGDLADRIVGTLAPSARRVALASTARPPPRNYRTVDVDDVQLAMPPTWKVVTPTSLGCRLWPSSYSGAPPELARIRSGILALPCPLDPPTAATATHDGVYLYLSTDYAPRVGGRTFAVLHHDATTVTVYAEEAGANTLDLFVRREGSPTTRVFRLGLGRDGRIAGAVLASIEATK